MTLVKHLRNANIHHQFPYLLIYFLHDIDISDLECIDSWKILSIPVEISDECSVSSLFAKEPSKKRPLLDNDLDMVNGDSVPLKHARYESYDLDKEERLSAVEEFIDSFNLADNDRIRALLDDYCSESMTVKVPQIGMTLVGRNALFAYWFMIHETFPDSVMKILEKRHVSTTQPRHKQMKKDVAPQVECVYKFSGTRIIAEEVTTTLHDFVLAFPDFAHHSYDGLAENMLDFISARSPPTESVLQRNSVVELVLTFECFGASAVSGFGDCSPVSVSSARKAKVVNWVFNLLASTDDANTYAA